jgi:hypothetical protein
MDPPEKYQIEDIDNSDLIKIGSGTIYYEEAGEDFSDAMVNVIKLHVAKIAHDDFSHVSCKQHSSCNIFREALVIINALVNSREDFEITLENLIHEVTYRLIAASTYDKFLDNVSYNTNKNDNLELPRNWDARVCQIIGDKHNEPIVGGAYVPSNNITYFEAIQSCKDTDMILDCGSAAMLHSYISLSDVLGPDFNHIFKDDVFYIATFNAELCGKTEGGSTVENPFFYKIVKEVDISDFKEIIPGDIVYFQNYPNYAEKHPLGLGSGEYAICTGIEGGEPLFKGHGIGPFPRGKIFSWLNGLFARDSKDNPKANHMKAQADGPDAKYMINNSFPGVSRTIYRFSYFRKN